MTVDELVDYCAGHDVQLQLAAGFLEWNAPGGVITPDVREAIETHARALAAIIRQYAQAQRVPCVRCGRFHFVEPTLCYRCRQSREVVRAS